MINKKFGELLLAAANGIISFLQKQFFLLCCPRIASIIKLAIRGQHYNNKTEMLPLPILLRIIQNSAGFSYRRETNQFV